MATPDLSEVSARGLVLLGCGKMGSALLAGWLDAGLDPQAVRVVEPAPSEWLRGTGVRLDGPMPDAPAVALIAVKPQMMADALPALRDLDALFISIAAGTPISAFETALGGRIIRAMPNTPAAVGAGITAMIGNKAATGADLDLAEMLLSSVGEVVRLESEEQMDAVTGLSGSGPAYVFHVIETLASAGEAQGLSPELSLRLARATVFGAGKLAMSGEDPGQLRINVTSPNGTTQAGLEVLMADLPDLMARTVAAAADRSRELRG
ncbi:pyrroline-5-carboxylate reductase [Jannaschia aquimarina]|uniref:Pyrroline-5-carboxylate reductase n=1 Tax=Jannaschia aquimarina TaxID=935700 RepID=A0A0D1ECA9_9RHOB|nr:pyrroline-5-carboxylate reductase [Jannaschia aquimarina]KIT14561.1 Pyrroline-5-carboxylate reductase [Jannaschia aquimarina]SNT35178.1 pyrroline-5-carboxylate reductase [Jannaschia aquimarina]